MLSRRKYLLGIKAMCIRLHFKDKLRTLLFRYSALRHRVEHCDLTIELIERTRSSYKVEDVSTTEYLL